MAPGRRHGDLSGDGSGMRMEAFPLAATEPLDDDALGGYDGPEPDVGLTYNPRAVLSPSERKAVVGAGHRTQPNVDDEKELRPLTMVQKVATMGRALQPTRSRRHEAKAQGLCNSLHASGSTLVVGCSTGKLQVVNASTMRLMDTLDVSRAPDEKPREFEVAVKAAVTCVRYLPGTGSAANVLLTAQGSRVSHVHVPTGKVLSSMTEDPNKVYNIAVRSDATAFATAGSDHCVRLYDEQTGQLTASMDHGDNVNSAGHSMDVFGLAWSADDANLLVSAGWDHTIQVWDARLNRSVRSIFGPYMCGDALDLRGGKVLAGSWRHTNPLELWDLGSSQLLTRLPFYQPEQDACKVYAAKFGRGTLDKFIVAGGSGSTPCMKVFSENGELLGTQLLSSPCYSLDTVGLSDARLVSVCCSAEVHVLDMSKPS